MRDTEWLAMRQLFGGGNTWVEGICLIGLFALVLFRREAIVNWRMFRFAYLFLAASVVLPPLVLAALQVEPGTFSQMGNTNGLPGRLVWSLALNGIGPILLAASIVCAFGSILPRATFTEPAVTEPAVTEPAVTEPTKHPLD
jgi:hypothetical protein